MAVLLLTVPGVRAQTGLEPVLIEAEDGVLGEGLVVLSDNGDGITYVTPSADMISGSYPGTGRTAAYEIIFPDSGWYDVFARLYVGPGTFDDDSFFYARSFGTHDPEESSQWYAAVGLGSVGFVNPDDYVTGSGSEESEVWKWVNISEYSIGGIVSDSFYVSPDELTVTFEWGAREDGLRIDRFAFGRSSLFYTVRNLENGEAGSETRDDLPVLPEHPLADGLDKYLGNVWSSPQLQDFEYYWNYVIPENAGKWGSVEGTRDQMNWAGLDAAYALAKDNGFPFNFHVLLWGAQQPGWISSLEPADQLVEIREWFEAVAERYPDIDVLQVVNEPLPGHNPPDGGNGRANYVGALGGSGETGWDWVITAFELAREIFPASTQLMINDFGILGSTNAARQYVDIIELLQERDLIDAIGVQGHAFSTRQGAPITQVLDILGATGLRVSVTEMDVDGNPNEANLTTAESDQIQLESMQRIFPAIWEHPSVESVTFWGWRPGLWRTNQEAYLVRDNGVERPAMVWLREYLENYATSAADPDAEIPGRLRLLGNYPNPFNRSTQIRYAVDEPVHVTLRIYDLLGRELATLVDAHRTGGIHNVTFDAQDLPSGIYIIQLQAGAFSEARSMVLTR